MTRPAPPPDTVDYRRTSRRPRWSTLPEPVRSKIAAAVDDEVVAAAAPVSSGFTGAYAGPVTLARGREVFVKAADGSFGAAIAQDQRILDTADLIESGEFAAPEGLPGWFGARAEEIAHHCRAVLAAIAVYMLSSLDVPPPPGCTPEMRRHQRLMAQAFLTWLGHRRRWAD